MPKARERLLPTTSMITAPTSDNMICVWITTTLRGPWLRRRGRSASANPNSAASGIRTNASMISLWPSSATVTSWTEGKGGCIAARFYYRMSFEICFL